jgi:hypothetical protein
MHKSRYPSPHIQVHTPPHSLTWMSTNQTGTQIWSSRWLPRKETCVVLELEPRMFSEIILGVPGTWSREGYWWAGPQWAHPLSLTGTSTWRCQVGLLSRALQRTGLGSTRSCKEPNLNRNPKRWVDSKRWFFVFPGTWRNQPQIWNL